MALGKGNALKANQNLQSFVDFDTTNKQKTFKANVTGKPLAHKFDLDAPPNPHPNRIPLDETRETGDGSLIRLGDLVHVSEEVPVEAIVTSIIQKKNTGKIFVTGTLKDESVRSWPSSEVWPGPLFDGELKGSDKWDKWQWEEYYNDLAKTKKQPQGVNDEEWTQWYNTKTDLSYKDWKKKQKAAREAEKIERQAKQAERKKTKEIDYDYFVKLGMVTEDEVLALKKQAKKDPTIFDNVKTPKKGTIRTWSVGDPIKDGGEVLFFARYYKAPFGWMVDHTTSHGEIGTALEDMWQHIPPAHMTHFPGRQKTWDLGNHVRFGHGAGEIGGTKIFCARR